MEDEPSAVGYICNTISFWTSLICLHDKSAAIDKEVEIITMGSDLLSPN